MQYEAQPSYRYVASIFASCVVVIVSVCLITLILLRLYIDNKILLQML